MRAQFLGWCLSALLLTGCRPAAVSVSEPAVTADVPSIEVPADATPRLSGVLVANGDELSLSGSNHSSDQSDENAVLALNGGVIAFSGVDVQKSGDSTDVTLSRTFGQNAAVAAAGDGSRITLDRPIVTSAATGSAGLFASDGAEILATDAFVVTCGADSPALVATRLGTLAATNGKFVTEEPASPCVLTSAAVTLTGCTLSGGQSALAELLAGGALTLTDSALTAKQGFSFSGEGEATLTAAGGSLATADSASPLLLVADGRALCTLERCALAVNSGVAARVSDGAALSVTLKNQTLTGSVECAETGEARFVLTDSSVFSGVFITEVTRGTGISLDASSQWIVTGDCTVGAIADADPTLQNIVGNGFSVYYDSELEENAWLKGDSYVLGNGGFLIPML